MLADWQADTVLISDVLPRKHPEIFCLCQAELRRNHIPLTTVPGMADLWIRDAAPVQVGQGEFVQFRYEPDYLQGFEHLITGPEIFRGVACFQNVQASELILDGGNIVGTSSQAIVTDKVYRENPGWSRSELQEELRRLLRVEQLIVIPKEPYDLIGHADGMVRFLDDQTVVVNDYRRGQPRFAERLEAVLRSSGLSIVRLPYVPETRVRAGIPSAVGNYVNFLRVGTLILLPAYGLAEDEAALTILANHIEGGRVVAVPCRGLAECGGVLNCATWTGRLED